MPINLDLKEAYDQIYYYSLLIEKPANANTNDEKSKLFNKRGEMYARSGNIKMAYKDFLEAQRLNPNIQFSNFCWGVVMGDDGEYHKAIDYFTRAIFENPNDDVLYINRGAIYDLISQDETALEDYSKAIQLDPNNAIAYIYRGRVQKRWQESIEDYSKAIQLAPNYADGYIKRGFIQFITERTMENKGIPLGSATFPYTKGYYCKDFERACNLGLCDNYNKFCQ